MVRRYNLRVYKDDPRVQIALEAAQTAATDPNKREAALAVLAEMIPALIELGIVEDWVREDMVKLLAMALTDV